MAKNTFIGKMIAKRERTPLEDKIENKVRKKTGLFMDSLDRKSSEGFKKGLLYTLLVISVLAGIANLFMAVKNLSKPADKPVDELYQEFENHNQAKEDTHVTE